MPNLFVIGASKSGSSALHAYLRAHPQIAMSREKEPCFFVDQKELEAAWPIMARQPCSHDWAAYLDLWRSGAEARYRGEGSVYYSQAPHRSGVPARIKAACPDARIVYVLREPVTRAIGHYWQRFKEFQEPLPLEQAIRENPLYRDTSDYQLQLEAYLAHFGWSQIHVMLAEDLRDRRRETLAALFDWLGVDAYVFSEAELTERHRSPPTSRRTRFPMVATIRDSAAWAKVRRHLPKGAVDLLRRQTTTVFEKADVEESKARDWLKRYFEPKISPLESLLRRDLPTWRACNGTEPRPAPL